LPSNTVWSTVAAPTTKSRAQHFRKLARSLSLFLRTYAISALLLGNFSMILPRPPRWRLLPALPRSPAPRQPPCEMLLTRRQ